MKRSRSSPTSRARSRPESGDRPGKRPPPAPGTITSLQSQAHDPDRVSIFLDGAFALGVARDVADEVGLYVGKPLDEAAIADLVAREELNRATLVALNFLAYRPRSEGEIRTRLRRAEIPDATIALVLEKLRNWHYVDDSDFARRWIENRAMHRPRGARLLAQELRAKGVPQDVSAEAIAEAELDEAADALAIARERSRQLSGLDPQVRERRLGAYLARRGYGFDIIRDVLKTLRDDAGIEDEFEFDQG